MRFADPLACPDCRGVIAGQSSCPHCGLVLNSIEASQLWQVLLQADDLLARAGTKRETAVAARAAGPVPPVAGPQAAPAAAPQAAPGAHPARAQPQLGAC